MEEARQAFRQAVKDLVGDNTEVFEATVTAVDAGNAQCSVRLEQGGEFDDVRLKATGDDETNRLLLLPKVGSRVLVGIVDGQFGDFYVVQYNAVEALLYKMDNTEVTIKGTEVTIKQGQLTMELKGDKLKVEAGGVNLKSLFSGIMNACTSVIISTPNGPGSATFNFATVNQQLNQLLG